MKSIFLGVMGVVAVLTLTGNPALGESNPPAAGPQGLGERPGPAVATPRVADPLKGNLLAQRRDARRGPRMDPRERRRFDDYRRRYPEARRMTPEEWRLFEMDRRSIGRGPDLTYREWLQLEDARRRHRGPRLSVEEWRRLEARRTRRGPARARRY